MSYEWAELSDVDPFILIGDHNPTLEDTNNALLEPMVRRSLGSMGSSTNHFPTSLIDSQIH